MLMPEQIKKVDGKYILIVTPAQVKKLREFNESQRRCAPGRGPVQIGGHLDGVEIVDQANPNANMVTTNFAGMVVGILPDGSAHS